MTSSANLTAEKVGKIATVLSDVLKFLENMKIKYALVWNGVPLAAQLYRSAGFNHTMPAQESRQTFCPARRVLVKGETALLSKLEGGMLVLSYLVT